MRCGIAVYTWNGRTEIKFDKTRDEAVKLWLQLSQSDRC